MKAERDHLDLAAAAWALELLAERDKGVIPGRAESLRRVSQWLFKKADAALPGPVDKA